ncbi:MAG: SpoIIE family protein phosphatase [Solobacterium sp.]|nr:SpoIIE family protein phosphatase [Solobacterium sp.]
MKQRSKLGTKLMIGILAFGLSVIIITTVCLTIWTYFVEQAGVYDDVEAYLKSAAAFIDGDRVEDYYVNGTKDGYYLLVQNYLDTQLANSRLKYFYVIVPREEDYVYIWDGTNSIENAQFGEHETYQTPQNRRSIQEAFHGNPEGSLVIEETVDYGLLATLMYPIYNSSGKIVAVVGADMDANDLKESLISILTFNAIVIGTVTLLAAIIFSMKSYKNVVVPIRKLNNATKGVVGHLADGDASEPFKVDIHTGDELEDLADSFSQMDSDLKDYFRRLETVTKEKEKIRTELSVAARIQTDMLPSTFPPFPDEKRFSIYASMEPARGVGGDFYDFFLIDETHLALVIADVSDKGVSAALFMARVNTLLKIRAEFGGTPKEIFYDINDKLCDGNESGQFVTVWMMILDIETGQGYAANAGHEYPAVRRAGQQFELLKDKHTLPLAAMPETKFVDYELNLNPGDTLFVYTDGAVEAVDAEKNQFTCERLIDSLNTVQENDPEKLISTVTQSLAEFVKDEPRFDDTTMLALCYFGKDCMQNE